MGNKNVINFDINSNKLKKLNLKDILIKLGGIVNKDTNKIEFDLKNPLLKVFPVICDYDCFENEIYENYITKIKNINNNRIEIEHSNQLENIDKWIELGLFPGSQVKIGDKKWMLEYIEVDNGNVIVSAREFNVEKFQNRTAKVLKLYFNVLKELISNGTCTIE